MIYLILGRPSVQNHLKAFEQAQETLGEDTNGPKELVPEEQVSHFAATIEKEIKSVANN